MRGTFRGMHVSQRSSCRLLVGIVVLFCATASCKPNPQHTPSHTKPNPQHTPSHTKPNPQHTVGDPQARIKALLADTSGTLTDDLIQHLCADYKCPHQEARLRKNLEAIEKGSISVDYCDGGNWGFTALHDATIGMAISQSPTAEWDRLVNILLNKGANPNIRDAHKRTPLEIAIDHQCVSIVGVLVAKGADLNQKDSHGYTPIEAARSSYELYRDHSNSTSKHKAQPAYEILQILQKSSQATNR